ncbi:MAG: Na(+)/H(+) antiporter subunit D [Caldimicrobium sp.]|nr:Na(+)/H(+) antiporter subunit D [Caldimicrobium sp.]MCX7873395.1 Na(+)/H(+) antiporter subunit D [Caldimicrobium sp.]MDW8094373.1 Na(+)/H(+) antiporter subunit D [Caldimicrobium sp.]
MSNFPPQLILILGTLLIPLFNGSIRRIILLFIPLLTLIYIFLLPKGIYHSITILDYTLTFTRLDNFSLPFAYIFCIFTLLATIFGLHVKDSFLLISAWIYAGSALGVVLAGDFLTLFLFWEIKALSGALLVWLGRTKRSLQAGMRYLMVHIFGGLLLLGGIILRYRETGSLVFEYIGLQGLSDLLILLGFGLNAAFPLLHAWVPDAYPESTETGIVFLSAFTTKAAVYALARGFAGVDLLIYIGVVMTVFPIFYAVIENNLVRVLCYSLINQVGFMVTGIGLGTPLSINGAVAHAFCNILFEGLLLMTMCAVLYRTGKINATDLGGLYKTMPWTTLFCIIGAASISGVPLTNGFVSKPMIVLTAGEEGYLLVWIGLLFASAGVFHHAGIKIPFFAFFSHDSGLRPKEAPPHMLFAMAVMAFLCLLIGIYPPLLYDILPFKTNFNPFTGALIIEQVQLLAFGALAFTLLILSGLYPPEMRSTNLDADWFYRKGAKVFLRFAEKVIARIDYDYINEAYQKLIVRGILTISTKLKTFDFQGVDGVYHGLSNNTLSLSEGFKLLQRGKISDYALFMLIGLIIFFIMVTLFIIW